MSQLSKTSRPFNVIFFISVVPLLISNFFLLSGWQLNCFCALRLFKVQSPFKQVNNAESRY